VLSRIPRTVLLLAAVVFSGTSSVAQENEKTRIRTTLAELSRELARLSEHPALAALVERARERVGWFERKLESWYPSPAWPDVGRPLREGLEVDLEALRRRPMDLDSLVALVTDVEADLAVKVAHCREAGLSALVTTKVRTFRAGQEVTGLEVFYIPKVLEPQPPANPPRFPALSATEQNLAPGRYVFWAGTLGDGAGKATIAVGNGDRETTIDLLVR
jgi:hypothetical protein